MKPKMPYENHKVLKIFVLFPECFSKSATALIPPKPLHLNSSDVSANPTLCFCARSSIDVDRTVPNRPTAETKQHFVRKK